MAAADFIQPPLALFTDARLTDGDRTVYCLLTSFGDYGTLANCKPSVASIAKRGGRSRRAVVENLKHLDATGWIVRAGRVDEHGDKDTTLYSFPFHRVVTETALPSASNSPTVVTETALRVVTQTALGVVTETAHNLEPFTKSHSPRDTGASVKPTQQPLIPEPDKPAAEKRARSVAQNPPTVEEVAAFFAQHFPAQSDAIATDFVNYWTDNGWKRGKTPMVSWKGTATMRAQMLKADSKWLAKFATNNGTMATNESWRVDPYYLRGNDNA